MKKLNRRNWLRISSLAGSGLLAGGTVLAEIDQINNYAQQARGATVKLSSNENPFGPSKYVREAITRGFEDACRYPFSNVYDLMELLAKKEGVEVEQIVVTGGSTEGLKATGLTYGLNGGEIISPDPTYLSLLTYAAQFGAYINRVPLTKDLQHDLPEMERRVNHQTRMIFVCNPNNPTGTLIPAKTLTDFCRRMSKRTIVFSDEAYGDFIEEEDYPSMVSLVKKGANVIVSRTFSKVYGLAGLRIGYLVARKDIASRIRPNVMANTNMLAIYGATAALEDPEFYKFSLKKNREAKEYLYDLLDGMGLQYYRSHTNFVFFRTGRPIKDLISKMADKGIAIGRPFPPLTEWCRISTGRLEDVQGFGQALKVVLS